MNARQSILSSSMSPHSYSLPVEFLETETEPMPVHLSSFPHARAAQRIWATVPMKEKLRLVRQLRTLLSQGGPEIAAKLAASRQRPVTEILTAEVLPLVEACRFLERHAQGVLAARSLGRRGLPLWLAGVRTEVRREALGVVLIIGPGNYPLLLPGVQLIQALVAGNAVLLKPGAGGTAAARALIGLLHQAGFDPLLITLLNESVEAVHTAINSLPDKVLFTGSAETGEKILAQLAARLIPATMELSGSDSVLVRSDADIRLTAKAICFGLSLNGGATCMAPKRVFVMAQVATELEGRLGDELRHQASACPQPDLPEATQERLRILLEEALASGAHFIAGGLDDAGTLHLPIVLGGCPPWLRLLRSEVFAPVLALVTVTSDSEALDLANSSPYALGASVFSQDIPAARRLASSLEAGIVTINDIIVSSADARIPFGGRKRSGFGATRGPEGLLELTTPKAVTVQRGRFRPAYEPSRPGDERLFAAYLRLAHGHGLIRRAQGLFQLIQQCARRN